MVELGLRVNSVFATLNTHAITAPDVSMRDNECIHTDNPGRWEILAIPNAPHGISLGRVPDPVGRLREKSLEVTKFLANRCVPVGNSANMIKRKAKLPPKTPLHVPSPSLLSYIYYDEHPPLWRDVVLIPPDNGIVRGGMGATPPPCPGVVCCVLIYPSFPPPTYLTKAVFHSIRS